MPSNCRATPTRLCNSVSWISRLNRARSASASENWRFTRLRRKRHASSVAAAIAIAHSA